MAGSSELMIFTQKSLYAFTIFTKHLSTLFINGFLCANGNTDSSRIPKETNISRIKNIYSC